MERLASMWISVSTLGLFLAACGAAPTVLSTSWHEKLGWRSEDYFDDSKVVQLCQAIESGDIAAIDRLVESGANVKAIGKDNMTPLLWALPDDNLKRFTRLLEHGADPNVVIEGEFNTRGQMRAGDSVTHMACRTKFEGYFDAVFSHGGDPNLVRKDRIDSDVTPLFAVIGGSATSKEEKVKALIKMGANIDHMDGSWATPTMYALVRGRYDIALILLAAGADHTVYRPKSNTRLVHVVIGEERRSSIWTPEQKAVYERVVQTLKDRGESFEEARADIARWRSWNAASGEYRRNMDAEIAERLRRDSQKSKGQGGPPTVK
ncbi:MAG: hypothetical protein SFU86_15455 [Pirellulaceae bacterium]|nr:hypothetical protein [Pirellulaceae bacterium]